MNNINYFGERNFDHLTVLFSVSYVHEASDWSERLCGEVFRTTLSAVSRTICHGEPKNDSFSQVRLFSHTFYC